ncbi:MAG: hypothetical protein J6X45_01505 [Lachnospiraceae bacterium]|nr:hypothetical protein [Lachnospiraceae bacterium]
MINKIFGVIVKLLDIAVTLVCMWLLGFGLYCLCTLGSDIDPFKVFFWNF